MKTVDQYEDLQLVHGDKVIANGEVRIVDYFDDDVCGQGCCSGYFLIGEKDMVYRADKLQLVF